MWGEIQSWCFKCKIQERMCRKQNPSLYLWLVLSVSALCVGRDKTRLSSDRKWDGGMETLRKRMLVGSLILLQQVSATTNPTWNVSIPMHSWRANQELETLALSERSEITGISKTWSCGWSSLMDGYRVFGRSRQGGRDREVMLYVAGGLDCMEPMVNSSMIEGLWLGIKRWENNVDVIVGVYYRPHSQDGDTD